MNESKILGFTELMHPSPKQIEFLQTIKKYKYTLYGGGKGGGKSYALRWALILLLLDWARKGFTNVRVMLACEDFPSLKDRQITKIKQEFPNWLGDLGENNIEGLSFRLRDEYGGGIVALRNLDDASKYASSEFAAIAIDELTKNKKEIFDQFRSILRWPKIGECKFIAGTNPGGIGNAWVKKIWIDGDFERGETEAEKFAFVKALVKDNPFVEKEYLAQLESLAPALRKAYLEGSWDSFEGQWADEWKNEVHVCDPFQIPSRWRKFRCGDHGRTAPTAWYWGAVDEQGNVWIYREHYKAGVDADVNAREVCEASQIDREDGRYWFTVLDAACWSRTGGETIAEIYERNGVIADKSSKDRRAGAALFHEFLRWRTPESVFRAEKKLRSDEPLPSGCSLDKGFVIHSPKMRFFRTCVNAIKTLPSLVMDTNDPEVPDTGGDDHCYDALTYGLMYMHEGRSPREQNWLQKKIQALRRGQYVSPDRLRKFYSNEN